MRWKAIYILLALLTLFGIIGFFFLDAMIGWSIEHSLETITGAKVDVNHLHLDLRRLKITIAKLQIANPKDTWRNLVETNGISFQMAWEPLFSGKIVIEEIAVADLMINTKRRTDGRIKKFILPGPFGRAQRKLNNDIAAVPVLNPQTIGEQVSTDRLFSSYKLKTQFSADDLRNQIEASKRKWEKNLEKLAEVKTKIGAFQDELQRLQSIQPKNIAELKKKLQTLEEIGQSGGALRTELTDNVNSLESDFKGLKSEILNLKESAGADVKALLNLAKLPDFESVNMAEALFGKALLNETSLFVDIVDNLQKQIPVSLDNPPKEEHPRGGQEIVFPGRKTYPRLLIKHVTISAKGTPGSSLDGYYAKGAMEGITSEPQIYGAPMLLKISGQSPNQAFLELNGTLNHLTPAIDDRFHLAAGELPLPDFRLPPNRFLPDRISSGKAYIFSDLQVKPGHFRLDLRVESRNLVCNYSQKAPADDLLAEIVQEVLSGVDQITIRYQLEGINKKLRMKISSDVDQIIANRFRTVIGAKVDRTVQEIRQRVNDFLLAKQNELETLRHNYQQEIAARLNKYQELVNKELQIVDSRKKEVEAQINQQTEKEKQAAESLKKELEDKIKEDLQNKLQQQLPKF